MKTIGSVKAKGFTFMDPAFPKGTPYRYDIGMAEDEYFVRTAGSGNEAEEIVITGSGKMPGSDWVLLAEDIEIRSGVIGVTPCGAAGEGKTAAPLPIRTKKHCCGSIFCLEEGLRVVAVRIVLA